MVTTIGDLIPKVETLGDLLQQELDSQEKEEKEHVFGEDPEKYMERPKSKFLLHWFSGEEETVYGDSIQDAFAHAGYGGGAINALDYYEELFEKGCAMTDNMTESHASDDGHLIEKIIIDDGNTFEGTLDNFADCFFSNVDSYQIHEWAKQIGAKAEIIYKKGDNKCVAGEGDQQASG